MLKCSACGKFLSAGDTSTCKCTTCSLVYHRACVSLPTAGPISAVWCCPGCKCKLPRDNKCETPVKGFSTLKSQEECMNTSILDTTVEMSLGHELRLFREELSLTRTEFLDELRAVRSDIQQFRADIADMKSSIAIFNNRVNHLECKVDQLEKCVSEYKNKTDVSQLEATVTQLKRDLSDRDQDLLISDIEITNLPEQPGENLTHLTLLIATKLNVKLEQHDILSASRAGGYHLRADDAGGAIQVRPRPLVVRLARPELREEMLRSARVRRGVTTADLGLSTEPRRFYLNERLTKYNRMLFRKARDAGKEYNWKYIWTRRGRTYARRDQGSSVVRIYCEEDITKLSSSKGNKELARKSEFS